MSAKHRPLSEPAVRVLRAIVSRGDGHELKPLQDAAGGSSEVLRSVLTELELRWLISWEKQSSDPGRAIRPRARGINLLKESGYRKRGFMPSPGR